MEGLEGLYQDPFDEQHQHVKLEQEATNESSHSSTPVSQTKKLINSSPEDILSRSIFVKNVDYQATVRHLEDHFKDCGPIVRTTIKTGPTG